MGRVIVNRRGIFLAAVQFLHARQIGIQKLVADNFRQRLTNGVVYLDGRAIGKAVIAYLGYLHAV